MSGEPTNHSAQEPYVTAVDTTVRSVDGRDVTLDETYFYAEAGGQPADSGTLGGHEVVDVQQRGGVTVHTLGDVPDCKVGKTVAGDVDDAARTYSMRAHCQSRRLRCGAVWDDRRVEWYGMDAGEAQTTTF